MLAAAAPSGDRLPPLFQLALEIVRSGRPIPQDIRPLVLGMVREAENVLRDPAGISSSTSLEAIQLAVALGESEELRRAVDGLDEDFVNPASATKILESESRFAASR